MKPTGDALALSFFSERDLRCELPQLSLVLAQSCVGEHVVGDVLRRAEHLDRRAIGVAIDDAFDAEMTHVGPA